MVQVKMAPDIEFKMEIEMEGIDYSSRDHEVQLHKAEVRDALVERLKKSFPEGGFRIDTFSFGMDTEGAEEEAA